MTPAGTFLMRRRRATVWLSVVAVVATGAVWLVVPRRPAPVRPIRSTPQAVLSQGHLHGKIHYDLLSKLLADDRAAAGERWLQELGTSAAPSRRSSEDHPLFNQPAVDFTLDDHRREPWNLCARLAKGPVVLVFYLGYSCPACVHDLVVLNADLARFRRLGADVAAVSADSPELTQSQFEQYGELGFSVLSDPEHRVAGAYGALFPAEGTESKRPMHATFVIARDGHVRWCYRGDRPLADNGTLLYELARLEGKLPPLEREQPQLLQDEPEHQRIRGTP